MDSMSKLLKNRAGVLVVMVVLGAGGAALLRAQVRSQYPDAGATQLTSWVVYWDQADGLRAFDAQASALAEIVVFAYHFDRSCRLVPASPWVPEAARQFKALALMGFTHHTIARSATPVDPLRPVWIYDQGSIKSLEQFAKETVRFITGSPQVGRMDPVETVLAMTAQPEVWAQEPLISIPKGPVRAALGLGPQVSVASLAQLKGMPLLAEFAPAIVERAQRGERLSRLEQDVLSVARRSWRLDSLLEQQLQLVPPAQKGREWLPILQPEGYDWGLQLSLKRRWSSVLQAVRMDQPERLRLDSQRLAWMLANLKAAGHPGSWWGGWYAAFQTWRRGVFPSGSHLVVASLS